jgi:hypothetical protein
MLSLFKRELGRTIKDIKSKSMKSHWRDRGSKSRKEEESKFEEIS